MSKAYRINEADRIYFLTFTVVGWADVFTRKTYRDIFVSSLNFCIEKKSLIVYAWVLMSNHAHFIMRSVNGNLPDIVRDFKSFTSKEIIKSIQHEKESRREWLSRLFQYYAKYNPKNEKFQFWIQDYHAEWVESAKFFDQKLNYVHFNPVRAGLVELPEHYLYSSARDYAGKKGLVNVTLIDPIVFYQ